MSDNLGKEMAIEAAKTVALEGYKDTLHPTLKAVGSVIALPFQAIDAALSKPKLWVAEKHYNYERTRQLLAEKLQHTPEELIVPPENYVAVPALQQIAYCFDSDELRDMYANLLANSMNKVVKNGVHPGFVEIIKQLSPDEAKILKCIFLKKTIPTLSLVYTKENGDGAYIVKDFSDIGDYSNCEFPNNITQYFNNLIRLGVLEKAGRIARLPAPILYTQLKNHKTIMQKATEQEAQKYGFSKFIYEESNISITEFGKALCSVCFEIQTKTCKNNHEIEP